MRYSALVALALLTVAVLFLVGLSSFFYDILNEEYRRFASNGTGITWMQYVGYPITWSAVGRTIISFWLWESFFILLWTFTLRLLVLSTRSLRRTFTLPRTKARWCDIALGLLHLALVPFTAHMVYLGDHLFSIPVRYIGYASTAAFLFVPLWLFIAVSKPRPSPSCVKGIGIPCDITLL